jgi:S-adenosylmethionine:tRNA ribosyltransferase-isomerase
LNPRTISIAEFDYLLPEEKIARYPLGERQQSKLLVYKDGAITDAAFSEIVSFLPDKTLLVFNESSVINARLFFKNKKGATIEIFCLEPEELVSKALSAKGEVVWRCLVGGLKKWKDESLSLKAGALDLTAFVQERREEDVLVSFTWTPSDKSFSEVLQIAGVLPVPPYLNRDSEEIDKTRYQTVYAGEQGSVAAPTAGLHFTPLIIDSLNDHGVDSVKLSLHVGSGTFKPVKADNLGGHNMHGEWLSVTSQALNKIIDTVQKRHPLITVGTTSLRAMESLYWLGAKLYKNIDLNELTVGQWDPYGDLADHVTPEQALTAIRDYMKKNDLNAIDCRTSLLIAPPYKLKFARGLITNFHQPRSTLLLLVAAVAGDKWREIYSHALDNDYRFLSYGDSSLLFS